MHCQFGELTVRTTLDGQERQLLLNNQVQGSSFLSPPSTVISHGIEPGPGPVSACAYALGWLLAGYHHPDASMIMVGLGSGSGAIQLLACCPNVDLTVIEICPEIIQAATDNFPLLDYYQDLGRLKIIQGDAASFFEDDTHWEIGLADAYTGKSNDIEATYLRRMHDSCDRLYLNIIDRPGGEIMLAIEDWLETENTPVTEIYRANNVLRGQPNYDSLGNWIVTNDHQRAETVDQQQPFEDLADSPGRQFALANWSALLQSAKSIQPA